MIFNLLLLLLLTRWIPQASSQTFAPGQTIVTAGSSSPAISSGNLSLGFISDSQQQNFELGIWYSQDPTQFLVWRPGPSPPTRLPQGSRLDLSSTGNLEIISSSTTAWSSETSNLGVTSAELLTSGNFVLRNSSGATIWSSFSNPFDTLLPNQSLSSGGPGLRSPSGLHTLQMESGNLTLKWNNLITYWSSESSSSAGVPTFATSDQNGVLRLFVSPSNFTTEIFSSDYGQNNFRRLTLDPEGNFRFYTLLAGSWTQEWQAVGDECRIFNRCGSFGICSYLDGVPRCTCPPGLTPVSTSDRSLGCTNTGNVSGSCSATNNWMLEVRNASWLNLTRDTATFNSNKEQCRNTCLTGAGCIGVIYPNDGSGRCTQILSGPLSGYSSPSIQASAFLKVCNGFANSPLDSDAKDEKKNHTARNVGIAIGATLLGLIGAEVVLGLWWYRRRRHSFQDRAARYAVLDFASGAAIRFTYRELENATYGFRDWIGEGGFGAVYKGYLKMNKSFVAVKKLEGVFQGEKEFRTEVATIGSTHHMNLMRLVGFCSEGEQTRLLVYDFMPNGSLDRFLFHHKHDRGDGYEDLSSDFVVEDGGRRAVSEGGIAAGRLREPSALREFQSEGGRATGSFTVDLERATSLSAPVLEWKTRFNIAVGAARGLAYLHEECRETIIHCDLKPENILLDENFTPKLSDFGLARLIEPGQTRELTTVRGSRGYMAPEWLANMPVTSKCDVYSYGIVLLELIGGRRNFDACGEVPKEQQRYAAWAYREVDAGRAEAIVDGRLKDLGYDTEEVERLAKVAFWCLQESAGSRPGMGKVVRMLEGNAEVLRPPIPKSLMVVNDSSSSSIAGGWGWASTTSASNSVSVATHSSSANSGSVGGARSVPGPR